VPTSIDQVYHYLRVDVNGSQVTVSPVNALGQTFDVQTYDFTPDTTKPTAPSNLQASAPSGNRVNLAWGASSDANGIQAYDIYRDGNLLDSVNGNTTTYSDSTVSPSTSYAYVVKARDPNGNTSDASNTANVTTPSLDTEDPTPPSNLQATAPASNRVDLTWSAGGDNIGITNYDIYRNGGGTPIASVNGTTLAYSDTTASPSTPYSYTVQARDAAGNTSVDSNVAQITTPGADIVFSDNFESGTLAAWTNVTGLQISQGIPGSGGTYVARETSASAGGTYAYKSISPTASELYAKFRFQVLSRSTSVDLMRFRNATGGSKLSLYVSDTSGTLSTRNSAGTSTRSSSPAIVPGQWYTVEVHAKIASPTVTEVWLDGVHLTQLDATGDIGSTNIGQFLVGTTAAGTYDVVFDDVVVAKTFI
jgi:chitodextrinase